MTAEAWVIALFAYSLSGFVVALWLWPPRSHDTGGDELVRGLVFAGWPCAVLVATITLVLRGFVSLRRTWRVWRIGRPLPTPRGTGLRPPRPWPERRP